MKNRSTDGERDRTKVKVGRKRFEAKPIHIKKKISSFTCSPAYAHTRNFVRVYVFTCLRDMGVKEERSCRTTVFVSNLD